jgi:hypothetical protein
VSVFPAGFSYFAGGEKDHFIPIEFELNFTIFPAENESVCIFNQAKILIC